jgi:hypothetical protein
VLLVYYFVDFHQPRVHPLPPSWRSFAKTFAQFLSTSTGIAAHHLWPYSAILVTGCVALCLGQLLMAWRQRRERFRAIGLLLFLAAMASLALGIAWGRSGYQLDYGLEPRYATLALPGILAVYFTFVVGARRALARALQTGLFLAFLAMVPYNWYDGVSFAQGHAQRFVAFRKHLRAGVPVSILAQRYSGVSNVVGLHPDAGLLEHYLRSLHDQGLAHLARMRLDQQMDGLRKEAFEAEVAYSNQITWDGHGRGSGLGDDPFVVFHMKQPRFVFAVTFQVSYSNRANKRANANLQAFWKKGADTHFLEEVSQHVSLPDRAASKPVTIWIMDTIDELRIDPDDTPSDFRLTDLSLLVPEQHAAAAQPVDRH